MYTLNNIVTSLQEFQQGHKQLNDFYFQPTKQVDTTQANYPLLWSDILSDSISMGDDGFEFDIIVADLVREGDRNLLDVWNDTNLIAKDLVFWFRQSRFTDISGNSVYLSVSEDVTFKPFQAGFTDGSAGWRFNLKFKTFLDWDLCGIPLRT